MKARHLIGLGLALAGAAVVGAIGAEERSVFVEAESFTPSSGGWGINESSQTRAASAVRALNGSSGDPAATASREVEIPRSGDYRIWVRHNYHGRFRGPFRLLVSGGSGKQLAEKVFDVEPRTGARDWSYVWDWLDVSLEAGKVTLILAKHEGKNCSGYVRNIDCLLLTTDKEAAPSHLPYGPQTWLRVTLAAEPGIYGEAVQIHVFADHFRYPWYSHWHLSKLGARPGLAPPVKQRLAAGEQTPWCNITPLLYQDSGAILNISARYTYGNLAPRLVARFEFATAPGDAAIVRTMKVDSDSGGLVVVAPPDLTTEENRARLGRDRDFAEAAGRLADAFDWPEFGKKPRRIPFFVSAAVGGYGTPVDSEVEAREWKTLDYFGFSNRDKRTLHGRIWKMKNRSFCQPDIEAMRKAADSYAGEFFEKEGGAAEDIVYCMLTDEPTGQASAFMAGDEAYHTAFRAWLKKLGKSPADLLVDDWEAVVPVAERERDAFPALHYFTQRFRTRALGDFMATQRRILEEAYQSTFPTLVNFSDGAVYSANFYGQGVDYFELLDDGEQNAIWGEDWANLSSSYQCGAYNVDLMRAAARDRGQVIGHYLISHAGRKSWDIKLKAASETARGVRIWKSFSYGVPWGSHEGGPTWRSHAWQAKPEVWRACAEVVREIGGAEDLLVGAEAPRAEVAILYSSSSDIWTLKRNNAHGFNRMHTWMALAHAQVPVDFVAERQVESGTLDGYRACYLSGPNLTREAAKKLRAWVEAGGVLYLSAGAAGRDEFNRPLALLDPLLPGDRAPLETLQAHLGAGSFLHTLAAKDSVPIGDGASLEVLSVRQRQSAHQDAEVLARFSSDGSPALVRGKAGRGAVFSAGFLPALDYIKQAEVARRALLAEKKKAAADAKRLSPHPAPPVELIAAEPEGAGADARLARSANPWEFSAAVREQILAPVRFAAVTPPLTCDVPLVDAVWLTSDAGAVIPLANYTLAPLSRVRFTLRAGRPITAIESLHRGPLDFETDAGGVARFALPLKTTDYLLIRWR